MPTSTLSETSRILDRDAMKTLAGCQGPCITMVIPAHRPGTQEGSRRALLHSLVRAAGEQMKRGKLADQAAELLAPVERIAQESGVEAGGGGFAIFRSPDHMERYDLPNHPTDKLIIGDHFYLAPFIADAMAPHDFFVLGLSVKHLRLLRYAKGSCEEMPLPATVPLSLNAAGGFDQPDHQLENRSASGPSTGAMRGVHFGTLSDREAFPEHLHHFFGIVDRELKPILAGKPLLLMGVHEEVAAYRRAAKHAPVLMPDYLGNIDFLTLPDIATRAAQARRAHYRLLAERVLADYQEMPDCSKTLGDVLAVVRAAGEGRVHRLCVRTGAEFSGPGGEDLINVAIVETLRTGGEVFTTPRDRMPATHPLAAMLRY